mgnify:FL=1|tara:strand:+ start:96 stop:728 length:633 start_codon:yes stop_codon:yes gene_type:complete
MEKLTTESGKSYWNNNGVYQEQYDKLYESLVPSSGESDTVHGEMLRAVSRLFYDYCNNGNCNIRDVQQDSCSECGGSGFEEPDDCYHCEGSGEIYEDDDEEELVTCDSCDGSGEEEAIDCGYCGGDCYVDGEVTINEYYQDMIDFLHQHSINKRVVDNVEYFITRDDLGYGDYTFDDSEMKVYNNLVDAVMYQILTTKNEKRVRTDLELS